MSYWPRRLLKQSIIYGLGDVAGKLLGFLLIPVYTNYLLPSEYGILNLCYVFSGFASVFCFWGINSAFFRYFVNEKDRKRQLECFITVFSMVTFFAFLVFLFSFSFSNFLSGFVFGSESESYLIKITAISILFNSLLATLLLAYRAKGRPSSYVKATLSKLLVGILCNLYFVIGLRKGVRGVLYSDIISSSLLFLFLLIKFSPYLKAHISLDLSKKLLSYGIPLVPAVLSGTIIMLSDRYFINLFLGAKEVGIYSLGYKLGMAVSLAVTAFRFAWSPAIFQIVEDKGAKKIFSTVLTHYVSLIGLIFLGLVIFRRELFLLFVNSNYYQGSGVVVFIAISYFIYGLYLNFEVGMYLKDKTGYVAIISLLGAGLNICLNLLLIPQMGINGAALATLGSYLLIASLGFFLSQRLYKVRYEARRLVTIFLIIGTIFLLSQFSFHLIFRFFLFLLYLGFVMHITILKGDRT